MSTARAGTPGATRVCPHCKAVVLETAAVCPGCRHHLRFNATDVAAAEAYCAFNIEGTIAHKQAGEHCEYCIVLDIRNERGEQIIRQVVGVGALHPGELRRLNLAVEMLPLRAAVTPKSEQPNARDPRRAAAAAPSVTARTPAAPSAPAPATAAPTLAPPSRSPAAAPTPLPTPAPKAKSPVSPIAPSPPSAPSAAPSKPPAAVDPARRPASGERPATPSSPLSERLHIFRKP
jgi:hypothetical protein